MTSAVEERARPDRFAQFLAVAIVVATLAGAAVEFIRTSDDAQAAAAAIDAQRFGILQAGQSTRGQENAAVDVATFGAQQAEQKRGAIAFQQALFTNVPAEERLLFADAARWAALASDYTGHLNEYQIGTHPEYGPAQDPQFPSRLQSADQIAAGRSFALQDAAAAERAAWGDRLAQYIVILTIFAVAIYLFGFSLALAGGLRRALSGLAVIAVVGGMAWTAGLQLTRPTRAPDEAATEYALGVNDFNTFYAAPGDAGLVSADTHLSNAIRLRPAFADAYRQRAEVRLLLGAPVRYGLTGVATPAAINLALADFSMAYDLGLRSHSLLSSLAFTRYSIALVHPEHAAFQNVISLTEMAIVLNPDEPVTHYNRAIALLADNDVPGATAEYRAAIDRTLYADVSTAAHSRPRPDSNFMVVVVDGAVNDLDVLAHRMPARADQVIAAKELIMGSFGKVAATAPARANDVRLEVFPGQLTWTAHLDAYDIQRDFVATKWYYQADPALDWALEASRAGDVHLRFDIHTFAVDVPFIQDHRACLGDGLYRVEIYINGNLVGQQQSRNVHLNGLRAQIVPELSAAYCRPPEWTASTSRSITYGFSHGYVNSDATAGVYLFRIDKPGSPGPAEDRAAFASGWRNQVIDAFNAGDDLELFPGTVAVASPVAHESRVWLAGRPDGSTVVLFGVTKGGRPVGLLKAGAAIGLDGSVVVGIVFGPNSFFATDTSTGSMIFASFVDEFAAAQ